MSIPNQSPVDECQAVQSPSITSRSAIAALATFTEFKINAA